MRKNKLSREIRKWLVHKKTGWSWAREVEIDFSLLHPIVVYSVRMQTQKKSSHFESYAMQRDAEKLQIVDTFHSPRERRIRIIYWSIDVLFYEIFKYEEKTLKKLPFSRHENHSQLTTLDKRGRKKHCSREEKKLFNFIRKNLCSIIL